MPKQWELIVDGRLENLPTIAEFIVKATQASGLNEKDSFEVQLAVDEACTNVIEHGYGEDMTGEITLRCECKGGDFVITIRDTARPFDPEIVPLPDITCSLEGRKRGGLGLYFMRKLMDEVSFHFDPEGTKLIMVKKGRR